MFSSLIRPQFAKAFRPVVLHGNKSHERRKQFFKARWCFPISAVCIHHKNERKKERMSTETAYNDSASPEAWRVSHKFCFISIRRIEIMIQQTLLLIPHYVLRFLMLLWRPINKPLRKPTLRHLGRVKQKVPLSMRKMRGFTSSCTCAMFHPGIYSPLKQSIVANDSNCGQRRPWSDCADAQANLGLRCPHMPEDTFSHGTAHLRTVRILTSWYFHTIWSRSTMFFLTWIF